MKRVKLNILLQHFFCNTNYLQLVLLEKEPSNSKRTQRRDVITQEKRDEADDILETPES
jgi:hypothetical protein